MSKKVNGKSMDNLTAYHTDSMVTGPHVLLTAGVHGDEYEPILAISRLVPELPLLLVAGRVTVVPVVNRSALEAGSRCGADGLDLARICPGTSQGTVSERAAADVSALIQEADYYVDLHTGGRLFDIYPLAGYMLHSSPAIRKQQQQLAQAFNLPLIWGTESAPNGRTLSVARDANVPAIYVEYGGGTGIRSEIVEAYHSGCLNVLKSLKLIDGPLDLPVENPMLIEDDTPNGGYLQGKMPAPASGIFEPACRVGCLVTNGQLWGRILDPFSGQTTEIRTESDGLVYLVRIGGSVQEGDALGGIMPVAENRKQ